MKTLLYLTITAFLISIGAAANGHSDTRAEDSPQTNFRFKPQAHAEYSADQKALIITTNVESKEEVMIQLTNSRGYIYMQEVITLRGGTQTSELPVPFLRQGVYKVNVFSKSLKYSTIIKKY